MQNLMNKCLYLRVRSKHNIKYLFCVKEGCKGQINAEKCYMCPYKEYKTGKKTKKSDKKATKKRQKVSHETYMKVYNRDNGMCQMFFESECEGWLELHHILYRSERRDLIDEPKNCIMLCKKHHELAHSNKRKYQPMLLEIIKNKYI